MKKFQFKYFPNYIDKSSTERKRKMSISDKWSNCWRRDKEKMQKWMLLLLAWSIKWLMMLKVSIVASKQTPYWKMTFSKTIKNNDYKESFLISKDIHHISLSFCDYSRFIHRSVSVRFKLISSDIFFLKMIIVFISVWRMM